MSRRLYLITPPTDDVVTLAEAKAQLGVADDDASKDALIEAAIAAAASQLDPAGGGWLGRALRPQTWELRINGFPWRSWRSWGAEIRLPYPPLLAVDSVKYDDADGVERTLIEGTDFRVFGIGGGWSSIAPIYSGTWPSSVRCDPESVRIRYTSGYENETAGDTLPAQIKQAVLLNVKYLFGLGERNLFVSAETVDGVGSQNFVVSENAARVMTTAAEALLSTLRVYE